MVAATSRITEAARPRRATWLERGQSSQPASTATPPATSQPTTRGAMASIGATLVTDRMNASISADCALRTYPPNTPKPDSTNPTSADAPTAIHTLAEASVPTAISGTPASAARMYALTRERVLPPKSAKTSSAITPKTQEGGNGLLHGEQRGRAKQQRHDDRGAQSTPQAGRAWVTRNRRQRDAQRRRVQQRD